MTMTYAPPHRRAPQGGLPDPVREAAFYDGVAVKRGLAWVVDVVLISILTAILVPLTAFTALFFLAGLWGVVSFLYRWATIATGSATWGMRLMAIELRERDGGRLSGGTALAHTIGYTVSLLVAPLQLISVLLMVLRGQGQGLTDLILGTAMVNRRM